MTGVKGRSGKVTTPEQRAARREAARAGGNAKAGRTTGGRLAKPKFKVQGWVDLKDQLECEIKRRKIKAADIEVEIAQTKLDQERGRLLTRDQVEERDEKADALILGHLDALVAFAGTLVPPETGVATRTKAQAWVDELKGKIADDLAALRA